MPLKGNHVLQAGFIALSEAISYNCFTITKNLQFLSVKILTPLGIGVSFKKISLEALISHANCNKGGSMGPIYFLQRFCVKSQNC